MTPIGPATAILRPVSRSSRPSEMRDDWHVDRLQRVVTTVRAWSEDHQPWTDAGLVALLLAMCLANRRPHAALATRDVAFQVALVVPLTWRRYAPRLVFAAVAAVAFVQWLVTGPLTADCALLLALFILTLEAPPRSALVGVGVLMAGVVMASLRWKLAGDVTKNIVFLTGPVVGALSAGIAVRTWRAYRDAQAERTRRLEYERDQQAKLAAAAERARIAREMHDVVAHNVSIMVTLADGALAKADAHLDSAKEAMADVSATGRAALTDMRQILGLLGDGDQATDREPQPQLTGLPILIDRVRGTGLSVEFGQFGNPFNPPPSLQVTIYRIVQESLTNVLKHAKEPSAAKVSVTFDAPVVDLVISDDGEFTASYAGGHGLSGMRERAVFCGGSLTAGPRPERGWEVRAHLQAEQ